LQATRSADASRREVTPTVQASNAFLPTLTLVEKVKYVKLGSTGLDVSRICVGCMSFGDHSAWMLFKDYVTSPIVGVTRKEQLEELVEAVDMSLSSADVKRLEEPYSSRNMVGHE